MKCLAPKNIDQRTAQCHFVTNFPLIQEIPEKQGRNLAKTEEVTIKSITWPGTSDQGLVAMTESIHQSQPQKMICLNSINHNFQKHTVVTIKKLTKNIDSAFGYGLIDTLAHRMWNVFLTSGLKSRQILVILFGAANMWDQRYKELLRRCYFGQLCSYGQETVRSAQNLLRQRVASLLSEERVRRNIQECRHIKKREAFYHYFMEFVQSLKKGPLNNFRINGQTSHRINQRVKSNPLIIRDQTQKRVKNKIRKMK